jgi:phosphoenolpyruvate carboxykinase (GTP)
VKNLPAVFHVNWFRKTPDGKWLWPGFGDNARVLEWILKCKDGKVEGEETFIGKVPKFGELNLEGLDFSREDWDALMALIPAEWQDELATQEEFLAKIGDKLPAVVKEQRQALLDRIG